MKSLASGIVDCEIATEFYLLDTGDMIYVFIFSSVVLESTVEIRCTWLGKNILKISEK